jgi:ABC-type antimicrobial peptide transport system permease subunit
VLSYGVTERRRELGIRVALGAASRQITWLVVREGLLLTAAGIALGIAGALIASRALSSLLFGVGATDASTYAAVATALAGVALTATLLPARRATQVDPAYLLRD